MIEKTRIESDSLGTVAVPVDKLWGAQTQRSLENFRIGHELMPRSLIYAYAILKSACAVVNHESGKLDRKKCEAITTACNEIISGTHDDQFPLLVWQTGSGTQTNMNLNEVIANRATQLLGGQLDSGKLVHPNDDVNMSQSSNDTFPSAMHIAAVIEIEKVLLPAIDRLHKTLTGKAGEFDGLVKIGRTHLQDATPLTLGQEISGWSAMLATCKSQIEQTMPFLRALAIGGTAVGTGINTPPEFGSKVAARIAVETETHFHAADNKFQALSSHDAVTHTSGALKSLAADLMKIANDVRWLASGPRCGIGEISIPANEPGSSIMPGKVNPTQCEALTMVACQVFGNDAGIGFAASQGNFQLNVYKPVIIYNLLQSINLLATAMDSFNEKCVQGIRPVKEKIDHNLHNSLMLVTALNVHIGYDNAAKIAKKAYNENITLKQAAVDLGLLTEEEFDSHVVPEDMVGQ